MAKMPVSVAKKTLTQTTATIIMKKGSADKTETIIANPKGPADEEVPTNFVPLGAIITDGDEINFNMKSPSNAKTLPQPFKAREIAGKVAKKNVAESNDAERTQAARMKELRLLSMGKKLLDCCKAGNALEAQQLMMEGAPFIADWVGTSPLHYSVINKHVEVTELLLKAGICKNAKNKVDRTPLHVAAHMGLGYMVKLLLSYGADVNCKDMLNMTPLHWVAESGDLLTAKILLDYGADTTVVNKFGKTAVNLADQNSFPDIIKEILETEKLHPDVRMVKVSHLKQKLLDTNIGISPVAEILEPNPSNFKKLTTTASLNKVVLVAKENPEGGVYRGTLQISSDIESEDDSQYSTTNTGEMSTDSALKLLKSHGVRMVEPDKDTTISSAVLNGHTIRLTDAGKLAFKSLERNLKIEKITNLDQALSPESDSSKPDRTSPSLEGPPAKMAKTSNGQMTHNIWGEPLVGVKNDKKIIIKGASISQSSMLPECVIDLPERLINETTDSALSGLNTDTLGERNAIYLQRMENKANLCLKHVTALEIQLKLKKEEYDSIRKQIEMFKTCWQLP